jgi:hypothetical protein
MKIGSLYLTRAVNDKIADDINFSKFILESLGKYKNKMWGELKKDDIEANNYALENGERILAKYIFKDKNIYIITEYDRSKTTILFCDEY